MLRSFHQEEGSFMAIKAEPRVCSLDFWGQDRILGLGGCTAIPAAFPLLEKSSSKGTPFISQKISHKTEWANLQIPGGDRNSCCDTHTQPAIRNLLF